jgi:hypothetical protein
MRIRLALFALALAATTASAAQTATPPPGATQTPPRPAPPYVVVQGEHAEAAVFGQQLTVLCPAGHRAFGAGYSALVRGTPKTPTSPPVYGEGGLDQVRSMPDMGGTGWQVSGVSPDALRLKQPWKLVVRVVCMQTAG